MRAIAAFAFLILAGIAQAAPQRVIVALREPPSAQSHRQRQAAIFDEQQAVLDRFAPADLRVYARWTRVPGFAAEVTETALAQLRADPNVRAVGEDVGGHGDLAQSVPLIHGDIVRNLGYTGSGITVAVLDSGALRSHRDLQPAIVDEACFCTNGSGTGCCPGGGTSRFGNGAAADANGHGTNITGIIASRGDISSPGVAPGCNIVSVRVLDANNSFSAASQVISGLDYVLNNHPEVRVVNMSLGTNQLFAGSCDDAAAFTMSFASAINSLKANGTAVFASSGNTSTPTMMSAPACIQNTIAVAAVYDSDYGTNSFFCSEPTAADKITCFSNAGTALDLLAPGAAITSDGNGGGLSTYYGTSQASAHAAGAAAVLFASRPELTPEQVETALRVTGVPIFDARSGMTYPRIDVLEALGSLRTHKRRTTWR